MTASARRLAEADLRVTRARLAILDLLEELGGHRSADDIVAASRERGSPRSRATVYHVLGALERAGLVLVADAGPGRTLYEAAASWHHHLVCRRCGAIVDVPCLRDAKPCLEPDLPGVAIDDAQVIFHGLCPACTSAESRSATVPAGASVKRAARAEPAAPRRR